MGLTICVLLFLAAFVFYMLWDFERSLRKMYSKKAETEFENYMKLLQKYLELKEKYLKSEGKWKNN